MIRDDKVEKIFVSFTKLDDNKKLYIDKLINGEAEIYIITIDTPPLKLSLAELS